MSWHQCDRGHSHKSRQSPALRCSTTEIWPSFGTVAHPLPATTDRANMLKKWQRKWLSFALLWALLLWLAGMSSSDPYRAQGWCTMQVMHTQRHPRWDTSLTWGSGDNTVRDIVNTCEQLIRKYKLYFHVVINTVLFRYLKLTASLFCFPSVYRY